MAQQSAFATGVLPDIYAFHRYTGNSLCPYHTQAFQFPLPWQWKLKGLSMVGAEGIPGVAVKCVDIGKNTSGEGALLGHY